MTAYVELTPAALRDLAAIVDYYGDAREGLEGEFGAALDELLAYRWCAWWPSSTRAVIPDATSAGAEPLHKERRVLEHREIELAGEELLDQVLAGGAVGRRRGLRRDSSCFVGDGPYVTQT